MDYFNFNLFLQHSINILIIILDIGLSISQHLPPWFNRVFIGFERNLKIYEYMELWLSFISIFATTYLSYLLLKVSRKSNDLSEKLSNLENKRDKQFIKSNAAITYYQMIHSLNELKLLYMKHTLKRNIKCNGVVKLHNEWISVLSNLNDELSLEDIDLAYNFFIDIESINNILDNEKSDLLEYTLKKYLLPCYFDSSRMFDMEKIDILTMLNNKMLSIIMFSA